MKDDLILEALNIIGSQLLSSGDFCGSADGRRLSELLYQLVGKARSNPPYTRIERSELVTRPVTLTINLDNAITVMAEKSGVSRNALIEGALEMILAEHRLA